MSVTPRAARLHDRFRWPSVLVAMAFACIALFVPSSAFAAEPASIDYIDEYGAPQTHNEGYTPISQDATNWSDGWYVVDGDVIISSLVRVYGDVTLVLKDEATLTVNGGINVPRGSTFTVYGQTDGTGNLTAKGSYIDGGYNYKGNAGIGGSVYDGAFGKIRLAATGSIRAEGGLQAAGVGAGYRASANNGSIVIYQGEVTAIGGPQANGIGGGGSSRVADFKVTIEGGMVDARGGGDGAGIGGDDGENSPIAKEIAINGGIVVATGSGWGAGIGGSWGYSAGKITITGGMVIAKGSATAGGAIGGGGYGGSGGDIIISGGAVEADRIGPGGTNAEGTFSTTGKGNAIIYCDDIRPAGWETDCRGIIFQHNDDGTVYEGKVYGPSCTLDQDLTLDLNETLTVEKGSELIVTKKLVNNSGITNSGSIKIARNGSYEGPQPSSNMVEYWVGWDTNGDGEVEDETYVTRNEMPAHADGSKEQTAAQSFTFDGWDPSLIPAVEPATYTAKFNATTRTYNVKLPDPTGEYTIESTHGATMDYGAEYSFKLNVEDGYEKAAAFAVKANGTVLQPAADGTYKVTITGDTEITVEGVAVSAPPVIEGIENGKAYCLEVSFGVTDANLVSVTDNDEPLTAGADGAYALKSGEHKIKAVDAAGNATELKVTVNASHTYSAPTWTWAEDGKSASASLSCTVDTCSEDQLGHDTTVVATVTSEVERSASCTDDGTTTYTAKVLVDGKEYSATKSLEDIPAFDHTFVTGTCTVCGAKDPDYVKPVDPKPENPAPVDPEPEDAKPGNPESEDVDPGVKDDGTGSEDTLPETGDSSALLAAILATGGAIVIAGMMLCRRELQ